MDEYGLLAIVLAADEVVLANTLAVKELATEVVASIWLVARSPATPSVLESPSLPKRKDAKCARKRCERSALQAIAHRHIKAARVMARRARERGRTGSIVPAHRHMLIALWGRGSRATRGLTKNQTCPLLASQFPFRAIDWIYIADPAAQ
jgi:hypothetical protein